MHRTRKILRDRQNDANDPTATSTVPWRENLEGLRYECKRYSNRRPCRRRRANEAIAQALFQDIASSGTSRTLPSEKRIEVREQYTYGLRTT
jgi:hypothetical protein